MLFRTLAENVNRPEPDCAGKEVFSVFVNEDPHGPHQFMFFFQEKMLIIHHISDSLI